ncbi:MAG: hypothetical protein E6K80_08310 [Candidatus Eisenbacteria bacterium]|uniref:beta-N-acetylhexosaminidase n=1 Tax=Eiseniibacteriota bacterium TaxID=2212470 RepID=A0A538U3M8_UNCEI|nr:MAG: hypothetical protein E6K80_08310 [Candidatus Eisenbacteria bacterium]
MGSLPCAARGSEPVRHAPPLVPAPRSLTLGAGVALLSPRWTMVLEDSVDDAHAAEILATELAARFGWRIRVASHLAVGPAIVLSTTPVRAGAFPRQAYGISIGPDRVIIRASTSEGRFYGVQTLRQLVRSSAGPSLPCLEIADWPAMPWRGVSDDVSRGQMSTLRDLCDLMGKLAYYKINLYGLYLEDVITPRPDSTRGLTSSDLSVLAAAARRNHITLLPIYQTMGWNGRILRELEHQAPPWTWSNRLQGTPRSPFSPGATRSILRDVDAIASAVPTPWFHLGGDELGTFGFDQPDAHGVAADGATHGAWVRFLSDHLRRAYGRRAFVYGDFLLEFPRLLDQLDHDTGIVDWNYDPDQTYREPGALELEHLLSELPARAGEYAGIHRQRQGGRRHGSDHVCLGRQRIAVPAGKQPARLRLRGGRGMAAGCSANPVVLRRLHARGVWSAGDRPGSGLVAGGDEVAGWRRLRRPCLPPRSSCAPSRIFMAPRNARLAVGHAGSAAADRDGEPPRAPREGPPASAASRREAVPLSRRSRAGHGHDRRARRRRLARCPRTRREPAGISRASALRSAPRVRVAVAGEEQAGCARFQSRQARATGE